MHFFKLLATVISASTFAAAAPIINEPTDLTQSVNILAPAEPRAVSDSRCGYVRFNPADAFIYGVYPAEDCNTFEFSNATHQASRYRIEKACTCNFYESKDACVKAVAALPVSGPMQQEWVFEASKPKAYRCSKE
ncbi:hypothetical protein BDV95DRAFT_608459 [Massariosphaeria phaeospora]|uniref:Uncharacterized protein n=1 Tax=Massariosphaeria phaeospora TaxID=100035 RepID=A0A7C8M5W0_9PLEO|nr:hypothetical protein BDV95DRAFT_608459 [Massariosphaeria phaeospora]